ncbi:predicted protein [Histoplasma mississippiense (nom. inval.)]|uniref:predicted protein n=1 Tax=Ajellomyces capsulatus (strain NAm1 / WU24) TaxID=2059318 RepID=UPI000157D66C|nr:predicted protein [Histoplasma mississippiense (nom. inval.)]EDN05436.1 predicted protein [Histoplasma mississippiense (nom. inval.)]
MQSASSSSSSEPIHMSLDLPSHQQSVDPLLSSEQLHSSPAPPPSLPPRATQLRRPATTRRDGSPLPPRRMWSEEEERRLLQLFVEYGPKWRILQLMDKEHSDGAVLQDRSNVDLKDKIRNMKVRYEKANKILPPNFEKIHLGPKEKRVVETYTAIIKQLKR